jgi:hypothetical protein
MAKIVLENTTKHMIILHLAGSPIKSVSIPGARPDAEQNLVNGRAEVDDDFIEAARKASKVVRGYFSAGSLRVVKGATVEEEVEVEAEKPGKGKAA